MKIKGIKTLIVSMFFYSIVFSQGNIVYSLQIKNNDNTPVNDMSISAVETLTFKKVNGKTDNNGQVILNLNNGKEWSVTVGEIKNCLNISSIPYSIVEMNEIYVYNLDDYNRKKKQDFNRTNNGFKVLEQSSTEDAKFDPPTVC